MIHMTWVRIPGPPILLCIIFQQVIQCELKCVAYHAPSFYHLPDGPRPDLVVQMRCPPCYQVKGRVENQKSQPSLYVDGPQNCHSHPPNQAQTLTLSLLLFFSFNYLLLLFLIINQPIKSFFFIKLKNQKIFSYLN